MSPQDRSFPRLPDDAEALLYEWPAPDRSALAWEGFSSDTLARIDSAPPSEAAPSLFEAPLPAEPGEGSLEPEPVEDAPNLAEAARAVLAASDPMSPKELARQGLMAAARRRPAAEPAKSTETAAGPHPETAARPADDPRPAPPPRTGAVPRPPRERRGPADEAPVREATARSEMPPATQGRPIGAAALGAAVALAASAALYFATRHDVAPSAVVFPTSEPVYAARTTQPSTSSVGAPVAASVGATIAAPMATDTAPATPRSNSETAAATSATSSRTTSVPTPALASRTDAPSKSKKASASAGKVVLAETAEAATDDSNGSTTEAPVAKAPSAPPKAPADEPTPSRPSVGLVQAAVGSVMMGARSCLAGQDSGSVATVTFGSDGRVRSVSISGPAAATPAEGCLKSALMGARVPPFSDPSYALSLTVRPP